MKVCLTLISIVLGPRTQEFYTSQAAAVVEARCWEPEGEGPEGVVQSLVVAPALGMGVVALDGVLHVSPPICCYGVL